MTKLVLVLLFMWSGMAQGQGTSFLSYRMGIVSDQATSVGVSEFKLFVPVLRRIWGGRVELGAAVGYHHADFGSSMRFWGDTPLDSWLANGALTFRASPRLSVMVGSAVRISRSSPVTSNGRLVAHQTALLLERYNPGKSKYSLGVAYRNAAALKVIPIIGYAARIGDVYEIDVLLPSRAYMWRLLNDTRRLGLFARHEVTPYPGPSGLSFSKEVLQHRMTRMGISFEQGIASSPWSIRTDLGASLAHDRILESGDDEIELFSTKSIVLDIALVYRARSR